MRQLSRADGRYSDRRSRHFIFQLLHEHLTFMDKIKNGWFSEVSELWPGQSMCLEVQEALYNERSKYQDILVFKRYECREILL